MNCPTELYTLVLQGQLFCSTNLTICERYYISLVTYLMYNPFCHPYNKNIIRMAGISKMCMFINV